MSGARDLAYLCRELKAPSLLAGIERLATRAREEVWSHEDFLAACLEREVSSRQSHGGEARIASEHQRSVRKDVVAHLGALDFIEAKSNAVFLGPPGCGGHCAFLPSTLIIRSRSARRPQRLLVFSA